MTKNSLTLGNKSGQGTANDGVIATARIINHQILVYFSNLAAVRLRQPKSVEDMFLDRQASDCTNSLPKLIFIISPSQYCHP